MECSKDKMVAVLERVLGERRFERVSFLDAYQVARRPEFGRNFFSTSRISYVMDGVMTSFVGSGQTYSEQSFPAGTVVVMRPYCLTDQLFSEPGHPRPGREVFGLVCRSEYLRLIYSDNRPDGAPAIDPDFYYHLSDTLRHCTLEAISVLCSLDAGQEANSLAAPMMTAICTLILDDLKASRTTGEGQGRASYLWGRLVEYLATLSPEQVSRRRVARQFGITETYVSRLFSEYAHMGFSEYVRREALTKAISLLNQEAPFLTIKQVADMCGFCSSSHFIRTFQSVYHVSPSVWRKMQVRVPRKSSSSSSSSSSHRSSSHSSSRSAAAY